MKNRPKIIGARHPGDGAWRAYADGELSLWRQLALRWHLAHCAICRVRLDDLRARGRRVADLLAGGDVGDVGEAWARVTVRAGLSDRGTWSTASAFLAGGLSMATLAASLLLITPAPTRLLGQYHGVGVFANVLDRCCSDPASADAIAPEGVFMLDMPGLDTPVKVHYSDVDGSGTFSSGDIVRSITRVKRR